MAVNDCSREKKAGGTTHKLRSLGTGPGDVNERRVVLYDPRVDEFSQLSSELSIPVRGRGSAGSVTHRQRVVLLAQAVKIPLAPRKRAKLLVEDAEQLLRRVKPGASRASQSRRPCDGSKGRRTAEAPWHPVCERSASSCPEKRVSAI